MSSANFLSPAGSGGYAEELTAIVSDPVMRQHARRVAGELFEDVLQETWYLVDQACARGPIDNLRGYFYRVMVNTSRRLLGELTRFGATIDPEMEGTSRHRVELAAASAESDALPHLLTAARCAILRCRRAELWQTIPACSPDPDRYRTVILAVTESTLTGEGPINRAEINDALATAYPQWFAASDATASTTYQRRCRARESIRKLLSTLVGPDDV